MTDIDTMPAGREMDALVAEKVMGRTTGSEPHLVFDPTDKCEHILWHYSTDIAAAWEVVEKLQKPFSLLRRNDDTWWAETDACECGGHGPTAEADTAPLAICRAALKAVA